MSDLTTPNQLDDDDEPPDGPFEVVAGDDFVANMIETRIAKDRLWEKYMESRTSLGDTFRVATPLPDDFTIIPNEILEKLISEPENVVKCFFTICSVDSPYRGTKLTDIEPHLSPMSRDEIISAVRRLQEIGAIYDARGES